MRKFLGIMALCLAGIISQLLYPCALQAQVTTIKSTNEKFSKLSEILPPPPDASAISRYGGIDVNLSTGVVNKSIALRTFTYRSLSVPITLTYASNGIKVNELPSKVGMGWTFQAGGSISRVVYGYDDFMKTRLTPSQNYDPNPDVVSLTEYCYNLWHGNYDSQPDVFTFSFGGYSGKFIFDHDGSIKQIPVSNLKIEFSTYSNASWNFCITTPDGVKYFFGGANAKDRSKKGGNLTTFPSYVDNVWYLNKISHPAGYNIYFTYQSYTSYEYQVGKSEVKYRAAFDADVALTYTWFNSQGQAVTEYEYGQVPPGSVNEEYVTTIFSTLTRIEADDTSYIDFSYSTAAYPEKLLQGINYFNSRNTCITKYKLAYDIVSVPNSPSMPFLLSVKETDNYDHFLNAGHRFEYLNKNSMPARFSNSQDHWGYYNGRLNGTLIPLPSNATLQTWFPNADANREPDPQYAGNGLLTSITYPTGGKDEIQYEANLITEYQDGNAIVTASQSMTSTAPAWSAESTGATFTIYYPQQITYQWHCDYLSTTAQDPLHDGGKIRIANVSGQTIYTKNLFPNASDQVEFTQLPVGTYTLYVSSRGVDVKTDGTILYRSNTAPTPQPFNTVVGGMRVKKSITSEVLGGKQMATRYYYSKYTELNISSARPLPKPTYYKPYHQTIAFANINVCEIVSKTYEHKAMYSTTINPLYIYNGGPVNYETVTISNGGDNFENGGTEHKFFIQPDVEPQPIRGDYIQGTPQTNSSWRSGREVEITTFKKVNGNFVLLQNTVNEYIDDDPRRFNDIRCWIVNQDYLPFCTAWTPSNNLEGPFPFTHAAYSIEKYYLTSSWQYISKTTTKVYDQNGQNPMTTVNNYFYDDARNLMLTRLEILNSKNELMKTQTKYPHDFAATGNVYEDMVQKNMIAQPVEEKTFNGTQLLERTMNNYDNTWYGDKHVVAVRNIETQKLSASPESRFRYYQYDTYGNPLELSKENDARQSFIWDYSSTYPIAKVSNASNADIAYCSFESIGTGNWTFSGVPFYDASAPTGNKVYNLTSATPISRSGLTPGVTYIISYWSKNGQYTVSGSTSATGRTLGLWTYYEHKVLNPSNNAVSITGDGLIDELRLYPEKAQMSTYTFEPLVGMTSQCDISGRITYYQYDGYNRLVLVRDENRRIISRYCYNYSDQPERCTLYSNVEKTGVFTRSNCPVDYAGTSVTYTVPAGIYFSNISQEDADQLAERDKIINGPVYANKTGNCILVCTAANCSGENKKCVNGVCQTGVKICTGSIQVHGSLWETTYHYEWSDGTWSQNYTEYTSLPCEL